MATYQHGITGAFKGKIGTVIGSSWLGIPYMKGRYRLKKNPVATPKQQNQQNNFGMMGSFMRCMRNVIQFGFDNHLKGRLFFSRAMSYALLNAIDNTTTPNTINYSKILVTKGRYPNATGLTASAGKSGKIIFKWIDNSGIGAAKATDRVVLVAYSPLQKKKISSNKVGFRSSKTAELDVSNFKNLTWETYVTFLKADATDVSSSIYTGQVTFVS